MLGSTTGLSFAILQLFLLAPSNVASSKLQLFELNFLLAFGGLDESEVAFGGGEAFVAGDFADQNQ